ncbi:MAG: DUF3021 domain-containing protein [Lachnospiraceae bacterium]|nr:DUF3021 domain-containing protein [Lachnospiraceae bacterium]
MNLKNKFILKASIGFSLGMLISVVINIIATAVTTGSGDFILSNPAAAYDGRSIKLILIELLTAGLLGMVGNGGAIVYEIESWSIVKSTSTHFVFTMITYIIVGRINGWLTPGLSMVNLIQIVSMIVAYILICLFQYLVYKREVAELNDSIKKLKGRQDA